MLLEKKIFFCLFHKISFTSKISVELCRVYLTVRTGYSALRISCALDLNNNLSTLDSFRMLMIISTLFS